MQYAGMMRRIAAMTYDALLIAALLFVATIPFIALRGGEFVEPGDNLLYRLTLVAVTYAFFVGFWVRKGRTLGMQSWRLRIESGDGGTPSYAQASIRFFSAIVSWAILGLGFLWQLWDKDGLTWHDRISGTHLVYRPPAESAEPG